MAQTHRLERAAPSGALSDGVGATPIILALFDRWARDTARIAVMADRGEPGVDALSDQLVALEQTILQRPAATLAEAAVQLVMAQPWVEVLKDPGSDRAREEAAANLEAAIGSAIAVLLRHAGDAIPPAIADRLSQLDVAGAKQTDSGKDHGQ